MNLNDNINLHKYLHHDPESDSVIVHGRVMHSGVFVDMSLEVIMSAYDTLPESAKQMLRAKVEAELDPDHD